MLKHFYKILLISTIAVLILFLAQTVTGFFTLMPLNGVTTEAEKPKLTLKNYADGSFQSDVDRYLKDHFGFRECLIRFYNQYLWNCFHETNNATVMRGKGQWLFEEVSVRDYYESLMYKYAADTTEMKQILETEALRMWKVQELLKEYNIHIFVDINPGKHLIYPEFLPKNRSYLRPEGLHAYDYLKKRFDELGVNYIDLVPVFKNSKDTVDYPLFTETGTHWSTIAATYAFDTIIRYMEHLGNQNLVNLDIYEKYPDETRPPDNDLELILNLARPIKTPRNLYGVVGVKKDTPNVKPHFVAVGDSYYWNILNNLPIWEIFQSYPYWYYNSSVFGDNEHSTTQEVDMEQELMQHDYIMLIYSTVSLYEFSSYFLPKALLHLCYDKTTIDSVAREFVETTIQHNTKLYNEALQVAEKTKRSVEDVLYDDALYLFRTEPEKYFRELRGDKLPTPRNKDLKAIRDNFTSSSSSK